MVSFGIPTGRTITRIGGYKITTVHAVLFVALAAGGFFIYQRTKKPMGPQMVMTAPDVQFTLTPANIMPGTPSQLQGVFVDMMGMPVVVPQGYYYVFILDSSNRRRLVSQGSLGMMVSRFNVMINTAGWQQGRYTVTVTDIPLSPQELYTAPVLNAQPTIVSSNPQVPLPAPITGLPAPAPMPGIAMSSEAPY
jgi:hypothetical protein